MGDVFIADHKKRSKTTIMTDAVQKKYRFQKYCVLFADVLNQAEKVDRLRDLPQDEAELPLYLENLHQTAGVIVTIAQAFKVNFDELDQITQRLTKTPEKFKKYFDTHTRLPIFRQLFSDCMLYYVPLQNEKEQCVEWAIYKMLVASYNVWLYALETGNPLRGAITLGYAGIFGENGLYGPALLDAYKIESNVAQYPRIVVATEVVQELTARANIPGIDINLNMSAYFSKSCLELLTQDADGLYVIDPLNSMYRDAHKEVREKATQSVNNELVRFLSRGDAKLAGRYQKLLRLLSSSKGTQ